MFFLNDTKTNMTVEKNRIIEVMDNVSNIFPNAEPPWSFKI